MLGPLRFDQKTESKLARKTIVELFRQMKIFGAFGGIEVDVMGLKPGDGLTHSVDERFRWQTYKENPWFLISDLERKIVRGWYFIEVRIRCNMGRGNAQFYFDHGQGFKEDLSISLPFTNGRISKRLYFLTVRPKQIRFDPVDSPAEFSIDCLKFIRVPALFARNRMRRRLSNRHQAYKGQSVRDIQRAILSEARYLDMAPVALLIRRYNETFVESRGQYSRWMARFETPECADISAIRARQDEFKIRPTISVIMRTSNRPGSYLQLSIKSVLNQSYSLWELGFNDDVSIKHNVKKALQNYIENDKRLKLVSNKAKGHNSVVSNRAFSLTRGDYVALLTQDDELSAHALHFVVQAINQHPSAKIFYSDEDQIDEGGNRSDPHFKPDWNPDLFFSTNYVGRLVVFQRQLLNKMDEFGLGIEDCHEYDLILKCLPYVKPHEIVHIPKVLYHRRGFEDPTAPVSANPNCAFESGRKALQDFFICQKREVVSVEPGLVPGTYRVRYPIPKPWPLVSIVIPTKDKLDYLKSCLNSIGQKTSYPNYEIIIVDNQSTDHRLQAYYEKIENKSRCIKILHYPYPFNFSAINNYAVSKARGDLICLLNNDIEVISSDWLTEMASHALRPEIGCVGAKLYYADETIQHAGVILGLCGVAGHSHKYFQRSADGYFYRLKVIQNLSAVTGACLLVRKKIYLEAGGFEENSLQVAFNDIDFCLKVKAAGYRNLWTPYAELYHHESVSRGIDESPEKRKRFENEIVYMKTKWGPSLERDIYYNPNLTRTAEDFSLAV